MPFTPLTGSASEDLAEIEAQVARQHDEGVAKLQEWIRLPSIAAEDLGFPEGPEHMAKLLREAGFQRAEIIETDGKPGVFGTLDAGADRTVGVYFMYDVKQFDPAEWSSPPLADTIGVFMPGAGQNRDGNVTVSLGAKGVIEVQLTASGERWGRGPGRDVHSSLKAMIDSPSWRLVKALDTLVSEDGNTITIDGYPQPRPISEAEMAMVAEAARRGNEEQMKQLFSTPVWIDDLPFEQALARLVSQPTVNIEGLVGGYTGPGGKTVLPHQAQAKLDLRLVPDMTAAGALAALETHLVNHGYGDIEVNMSGGYDPTSTEAGAPLIQAQIALLKDAGIDPILWPRSAGSYPGYIFTDAPLNLASGHYGLGHGSGAHAPDEYFVIESAVPNIDGWDGAVMSYVRYLYKLADQSIVQ